MAMSETIPTMRITNQGALNQNVVMNPNRVMRKGMSLSKMGLLFTALQAPTDRSRRWRRGDDSTVHIGRLAAWDALSE